MNETLRGLVFDDEGPVAALLTRQLARAGVTARAVTGTERFLRALLEERPELAIVDLSSLRTNEARLAPALAATGFGGEVILISGLSRAALEASRLWAEAQGIQIAGTLQKPHRGRDLQALVEHWLAGRACGRSHSKAS
ncbi:hypothetical protein [Pseudoroseicyclus sp. CXY001]|uniref:hypothetical protein n=1 Tax=Pseudoroseicyclus sp. CXY001 TaxID=3242492 RepID=UPI0035713AA6